MASPKASVDGPTRGNVNTGQVLRRYVPDTFIDMGDCVWSQVPGTLCCPYCYEPSFLRSTPLVALPPPPPLTFPPLGRQPPSPSTPTFSLPII